VQILGHPVYRTVLIDKNTLPVENLGTIFLDFHNHPNFKINITHKTRRRGFMLNSMMSLHPQFRDIDQSINRDFLEWPKYFKHC